jgi:TolB-like protein/DNA-binding SARP family transcriptional activator/Tfp pilus assembly protein PilF
MPNVVDTPAVADTASLRLSLLGGFAAEIERRDGARSELRVTARKARALLAYLAVAPRQRASRERLASLLWGDRVGDPQARQSLRQSLVVLRQELAPLGADPFLVEADEIALKPGLVQVDAVTFARLAQSSAIADLEQAAALYRGEFLAGLSVEAEAFEDWRRVERVRLEALAAHAFAEAAAQWDASGDPRAVDAAARLTALDPLREDWQRQLFGLLARYRGRDAALAEAAGFAALLARELDAEPSPETTALVEEIRRGAVAPARNMRRRADDRIRPQADASRPADASAARERMSVRWRLAAIVLAVLATVAAGATLLSERVAPSAAPQPSVPSAVIPDPSWRSPGVAKDVKANETALGANGVYPIVVLPFSTDAPADSVEHKIAAQMTDDLINDLSRAPSTRVISRQTSRLYAGRPVDVAAIGAELGVRYVVEGSVRRQDDVLRINIALIDTRSRLQVWSDRFERPESERFEMQDEIARGLARQLHVTVMSANVGAPRGRTSDPALNEMIANGWAGVFRSPVAGHTGDAELHFNEILRRKPETVPAMVGLAAHHLALMSNMLAFDDAERLARAEDLLAKAVSRNPRASIAHYFTGVLHKQRGAWNEAHAAFTRTLEMNPSHAPAYAHLGHTLMLLGRAEEALDQIRYAIRLSPKDPTLGYWYVMAGEVELELGHTTAALDWLNRAVTVSPANPRMHVFLAAACAVQGDTACATRHAAEARRLAPELRRGHLMRRFANRTGTEPGRKLVEALRQTFAD